MPRQGSGRIRCVHGAEGIEEMLMETEKANPTAIPGVIRAVRHRERPGSPELSTHS